MHLWLRLLAAVIAQTSEPISTHAPRLFVDTTSDAALPCRAGDALAQALRRRLPGVWIATEGASGAGDLTAWLRREDDHWALALSRAGGEAVLVRELAQGSIYCQGLAETAALIVDRFLTDVNWPGLNTGLDPQALAAPPPPPRPPPPAPRPPFWRGATFAAGPSLRAIRGESVDAGAFAQAGALTRHGLMLDFEALAYSSHRNFVIIDDPITGPRKLGSLVTQSAVVWAGLGVCRGQQSVVGCAQLRAGGTFLNVSPRGRDLHAKDDRSAWRPTLGGGASVGYALPWRLEVVTALGGMLVLEPVSLVVEGLSDPAYTAPEFAWLMSLGLKRTFF